MVITIALYQLMEYEKAIFLTTSRICAGSYWGMLSSNLQIHVFVFFFTKYIEAQLCKDHSMWRGLWQTPAQAQGADLIMDLLRFGRLTHCQNHMGRD